jgi:hypothetical protein
LALQHTVSGERGVRQDLTILCCDLIGKRHVGPRLADKGQAG